MAGVSQLAPGTSLSTSCADDSVNNWGEVGRGPWLMQRAVAPVGYNCCTRIGQPSGLPWDLAKGCCPERLLSPLCCTPGMAEGGLAPAKQPLIPQIISLKGK